MKIAIIEPVGGHGGLEIYDFGISKSLSENNCEVALYTCDETKGYELEKYFKIKRYFKGIYGKKNAIVRFALFLKGLVVTFHAINKTKPDVIYLHVFTFSIIELLLIVVSSITNSVVFVNVHDPISFGNKESVIIKYVFGLFFNLNRVNVTTHTCYSRTILLDLFPDIDIGLMPHSDIDFIYDNKSSSECKSNLGLDSDTKYILFFGQIKKTKGLDVLLKAWARVIITMPDARLIVVGRCWKNDCSAYKSLINDIGIQNNVIWNDAYINDTDVPCYFHSAAAVVLPYTRIYSSGVLLRAMGYATPVIVSDQPAFTEIIEHNKSGLIFETNNIDSLAEQLIYVLTDKDMCDLLKDNASRMLESKYSWEVVAKKTLSIFKGAINV